jgi:carbamoyl-phosphate synthase small subunit
MKCNPIEAKLILENGMEFTGYSFGSVKNVSGEVVFNTGMVGYPESLTDPSYKGQILVMTYPLIGNYGVPDDEEQDSLKKHFEADRIHIEALVTADYSSNYSHWNARKSLPEWLKEHNIPGIFGIDTRELTKVLRENGTMLGKIAFGDSTIAFTNPYKRNLVSEVSIKEPVVYENGSEKIIVVDCGVKNSIIRAFLQRNITVIRVPWDYDFTAEKVDGIVISNGPGNPEMCIETVENVRKALKNNIPILGVCLGSQIIGLSAGAKTYKLKYGHRSHNQPCIEVGTNKCYITSQNHGYAIELSTLPEDWREWFYNNNDMTNEGIIHISKPFFGAQFHPEASPGPDDTEYIFNVFLRAMK